MKFGHKLAEWKKQNILPHPQAYIEYKTLKKILNGKLTSNQFPTHTFFFKMLAEQLNRASNLFQLHLVPVEQMQLKSEKEETTWKDKLVINIKKNMFIFLENLLNVTHVFPSMSPDEERIYHFAYDLAIFAKTNQLIIRKILKKYDKKFHAHIGQHLIASMEKHPFFFPGYLSHFWDYARRGEILQMARCLTPKAPSGSCDSQTCAALRQPLSLSQSQSELLLTSPSPTFLSLSSPDLSSPSLISHNGKRPKLELPDDFTCPICLDIFYEPVCFACNHRICKPCAIAMLAINSNSTFCCPLCRTPSQKKHMKRIRSMDRFLYVTYPRKYVRKSREYEEDKMNREINEINRKRFELVYLTMFQNNLG